MRRTSGLTAAIIAGVVLGAVLLGVNWWAQRFQIVLPLADRCSAIVNGETVEITPEQSRYAAIIAAEAARRDLPPRATSIALATAYQESGLRNIDYGDRDSVGLFQQRPSQGWGSADQLLDPWYSSGKFYEVLVTIPQWETSDLNDIAQRIQISAFPEAYRQHVAKSRLLASALRGETKAAFGCSLSHTSSSDPVVAAAFLERTFGQRISVTSADTQLLVTAQIPADLWSAASVSIANASVTGLVSAQLGDASWTTSSTAWVGQPSPATQLILSFS